MPDITISLSDEHFQCLREIAARFGVASEEFVRVSVEGLLARPEEEFRQALEYVLRKNADLYRRLA